MDFILFKNIHKKLCTCILVFAMSNNTSISMLIGGDLNAPCIILLFNLLHHLALLFGILYIN